MAYKQDRTAEDIRREITLIDALLASRSRSSLIPVAPAKGLSLTGVDYPAEEELAARALLTRATREPGQSRG